jgi:glutathione S-transferase
MPVKLHRCPVMWPNTDKHPCFRVQNALDDAGVPYEIVKVAWPRRSRRSEVLEHTGQIHVPAIELPDGTWYRDESAVMARVIREGRFDGIT